MDFSTLKTRIADIIGRAPSDICYELVTADINQELRLRGMEKDATLTDTTALPDDFLGMVSAYLDTDPRCALQPMTQQQAQRNYTTGTPTHYAIENGNLVLVPSGTGTVKIRYYAKLADLAIGADTNDILTNFPSVYVYGVLTHHALLIRNAEGAQSWGFAYQEAKAQARKDTAKYRGGAGPMSPTPRAVA